MRSAGEATRDRILAAAKEEFARYGVAGARINRIAEAARASKDRLYAYFESKEALFAAVIEQWIAETTEQTALRGDDLPGYAGRLFDDYVAHPENARLQEWADLEMREQIADSDARIRTLRPKADEIRRGQQEGLIDPSWNPGELLLVITDIARTLATARGGRKSEGGRSVEQRRQTAVEAVRRLVRVPAEADAPGR
ncbi:MULTISPECIES: TetR/AcrR family transcriptional regulator [unclassified Rhodococcus (in: high G+C Gram-positive bacteria)]|uniref:TetR/AcrR family transcriptional regulator n=1 Tax=unclassified Rhodococcus (in: high G+C Gram-positive bacteria) TaxID=192944 RepID=UPI0016399472|nr:MULTISPECIES: TetR family transcriptional regulator [unclassified Rhodococcus (in: high G+C Gram-positive bacteria)]MBC2639833.1 TetR family transcriptional regulator [Rhodococcus sp. 3A]MBC2895421.1 TetR family transcriptional regulator [Rhodococcus sp. 4CII]